MRKNKMEVIIGSVIAILLFLLFLGISIVPVLIVLSLAGFVLLLVMQRRGGAVFPMAQGEQNSHHSAIPKLTFEDIGGQEHAKRELMEAMDFIKHADDIARLGIRPLKGILLTGPPGTGKTLMAKAAAHYTDSVFVTASGSEFVEMYVGVGSSRIRDLFKKAKQQAKKQQKQSAVIFIDEIDVIGGKREGGQQKEYDQTLNQLLTEMDGIHGNEHPRILIMAATNRKSMLDPALLRPGRFDRHIQVDLPDKKGRMHILKLHAKNKPLASSVQLESIAEDTFQFSGAQLESVLNEAAIYALREKVNQIEQAHISRAIDKVLMGEQTDREVTSGEKERVGIHEMGHAITAECVQPGAVSQIVLSPRGQALGFVRHRPQKEKFLYTKSYVSKQIMIALGGAAAEEIYYGERSTGSSNDFEQALNMVQNMIASGLTSLGIVSMETVAKEVLHEQHKVILDELFAETKALLEKQRHVFERCLPTLMKEEVISGENFRNMLDHSMSIA
ncbi:AAA family ATPase [Longirhabdus pacifica]|uniref:AAA family ATPase n=1 Tax=Longirhabdus pacifica TaxID=2305227 RepID=UPI001008F485|nr:AAA family ATPase [Longirhabdus pacifica]